MSHLTWPAAPPDLEIAAAEVHVWAARLALPPLRLAELAATLDAGERERAARFLQPLHRDRFIAAHGWLRQLLGRCLLADPASLRFSAGPQGKPALPASAALQFNLAHSGEVALIALARGRAVGVDVEQVRAMPDAEAIAARFFSTAEQAALAALPPAGRNAAFFNLWTRKEAWIKATGAGLSYPIAQLTVALGAGDDDCLLSAGPDPATPSQWRLRSLDAAPGYAAAAAAQGRDWSLHLWRTI
ncbi:MAG: 4'-phosphopantetheinyl transferase superfamily protein [Anaerolineales bacterium]